MSETTLRVSKIKDGTVIDHITAGHALNVLKILGITDHVSGIVTVGINVPSKTLGLKDMVKIEGRELKSEEVDKIALLAPHASINIIRNYEVVEKQRVSLPHIIREAVKCANPACISNSKEPVKIYLLRGQQRASSPKMPLLWLYHGKPGHPQTILI